MDQIESLIAQAQRDNSAYLDLSYMGLRYLSPYIGELEDLVDLDLRGNILDSLPNEISRLRRLTGLHLDGNNFGKLPTLLFNMAGLERLSLSNNRLTNLPKELGNLEELVSVDISSNSFGRLPAVLWGLKKLARLDASDNEIERIPGSIGALTNLAYLDLSRNRIGEMPARIGSLSRLRYLGLNGNSISELPGRLFALQNITHLNISENVLDEIQNRLADLSSLVHLDISGHHDADIPPEIFDLFESGIAVCDYLDTPEVPIFFLRWALQFREDALLDNDGRNCREIKALVQGTVDLLRFWAVDMNSGEKRWVLDHQEYGLTGPGNAGYVLAFRGGTLGQELFEFGDAEIDGLGSFPVYDDLDPVARILVDNEKCIFSYGCDLAQMWMIYHFDCIEVTRVDGRSLSDQNLKDIEQEISEDIYADFNEEDDELRLEFGAVADKMSLRIDFLRQY